MSDEFKRPEEWERIFGIMIHDPDGWRGISAKPFDEPISEKEFHERAALSTVSREQWTEYLLPGQAAVLLHVHPKTLSRWAREGKIPFVKTLGGHRRFSREWVERKAQELEKVDGD